MENSAFGVRARFCASTLPTSGLAGGSTEEPFGEVWRVSVLPRARICCPRAWAQGVSPRLSTLGWEMPAPRPFPWQKGPFLGLFHLVSLLRVCRDPSTAAELSCLPSNTY